MNYSEFSSTVKEIFEESFQKIFEEIRIGKISINNKYSFPSYLRIGESPHHWMAELNGASEMNEINNYKLDVPNVSEKYENTSSFFNPGVNIKNSMKPAFNCENSKGLRFMNLCIATKYDYEVFKKFINVQISSTMLILGDAEAPVIIQPENKFIYFYNVDIIRTENNRLFFKSIPMAIAVKKNITSDELKQILKININKLRNLRPPIILGLNVGYSYSFEKFARDLLSLTSQPVNENIIDKFIQHHMKLFTQGLKYQKGLNHVELKILEGNFGDKESLKPDFLMLRNDGYYDIIDLKTSALKYKSITVGNPSRMRFNSYVNELISQLVGYERYFKLKKNRRWALKELNIKVRNPILIGIVGSFQNFDDSNVELALEQFKDNIAIFSYTDLIDLIKKNK